MIKVSIIVPIYNVEQYIERCLNSLINQTLKEIEIIIVNDGTLDNSMSIVEQIAKDDERIKIFSKNNSGLGLTRNYGISKATGEYIAFVDSDDFIDLNFYETLYNSAIKNNVDMCIAEYAKYYNDGKIVYNKNPFEEEFLLPSTETFFSMLDIPNRYECNMGMSVWKAIYKRKIILENKIQFLSEREILSEDIFFNYDYLKHIETNVVFCKDIYYYYCLNTNSLTHTYREDRFEKSKKLREKLIEKAINYNDYEYLNKYIESFFMSYVRQSIKQEILLGKNIKDTRKNILKILNDDITRYALNKKSKESCFRNIIDFLFKFKLSIIVILLYKIKK